MVKGYHLVLPLYNIENNQNTIFLILTQDFALSYIFFTTLGNFPLIL